MAAGNFTLYNNAKLLLLNGGLNMATDAVTAILVGSGYTPAATHSLYSDVSANEIADAGYAQQPITGQTVTEAGAVVTVDTADISFGSAVTLTAKYLVLVKGTAGALTAGSVLVGYCDLNTGGGTVSSTAAPFSVTTPTGLFTGT